MPSTSKPTRVAAVPQMRRHKAKDLAYVNLGGQVVYLGRWGSATAQAEYDRAILEYLSNGRRAPSKASDTTVAELVDAYLDFAKSYYQTRTTGEYDGLERALKPVAAVYGRDCVAEFGPLKLKVMRQRWISENRVRNQINKAVQRVVRCFRWGVENELVPGEVVHALKCIAGLRAGRSEAKESDPVLPVDDAAVEAVLPFLPTPVRAMVEVQRLTGMRPGEVVQMTAAQIDRSSAVWIYRPQRHKTEHHGKTRAVFVGPQAQTVLAPFLDGRDFDQPLFSPCEAKSEVRRRRTAARKTPLSCGNSIGTNRKGKPKNTPADEYSATVYARAVRRACLKANVKPWSPNRLRHTFATRVRKAHGLEAAQVLLGHARADVTQVYAERDEAKAAEVAAVVG